MIPPVEILDPCPEAIFGVINAGLDATNAEAGIARVRFALICRRDDELVGGITVSLSFGVLFVDMLWVSPIARRQGIARTLVLAAEREGMRRGATCACVDTLSTQAPLFYPRVGYHETGRVSGAENGKPVARIWFQKTLDTQTREFL
jgi:ribosomal protein S18 acetylase RimI-like enzyme